jgi:hypothetical protein
VLPLLLSLSSSGVINLCIYNGTYIEMGVFSDEIPVCGVQYVGLLHPIIVVVYNGNTDTGRNDKIVDLTRLSAPRTPSTEPAKN